MNDYATIHEIPAPTRALPPVDDPTLLTPLKELERRHIERVLRAAGGNQRLAARMLSISRWSLARRLRKYGIRPTEVAS